jgi:hypothetical protein
VRRPQRGEGEPSFFPGLAQHRFAGELPRAVGSLRFLRRIFVDRKWPLY